MTDNEYILYKFQEDRSIYNNRYIPYLNYNAKIIREELFQLQLPKKQTYNPELRDKLIKYYCNLKFHADDAVITKFKEFGFDDALLRWFIPLKEIEEQFSIINNETPLTIFQYFSLSLIDMYLNSKMLNEIYTEAGFETKFKGRIEKNFFYINLYSIFRRKEYIEKTPKKNKLSEIEKTCYSYLDELNEITHNRVVTKKLLLDFFSGKAEKYFIYPIIHKVLYHNKFSIKELSDRKCSRYLFELCKLIMKDQKKLLSEDEFLETKSKFYGDDFPKYCVSRLNRILSLKKSVVYKNWGDFGA